MDIPMGVCAVFLMVVKNIELDLIERAGLMPEIDLLLKFTHLIGASVLFGVLVIF